jgi:hypothetical protein
MKKIPALLFIAAFPTALIAQKSDPICISYYQYMNKEMDQSSGKYMDAVYLEQFANDENVRKDYNFNYDKLDEATVKKLTNGFVTHIQNEKTITNFVDFFSLIPESPGAMEITLASTTALSMLGDYYHNPEGETLTYDGTSVNRDGLWFIKGDEINKGIDTIFVEDIETGDFTETAVENIENLYQYMVALRFIELWDYDVTRGRFKKNVEYLGLDEAAMTEEGDFKGLRPMFMFKTYPSKRGLKDPIMMLGKNIMNDVLFDRYATGDGYCGLQNISNSYNYIEPNEKYKLLMDLLEGVRNGNHPVYESSEMLFDRKEKPMTKAAYFKSFELSDKVFTEDIETGDLTEVTVNYNVELSDIIGLKFVEDWYFDPNKFVFCKRVKYIGLLENAFSEDGTLIGTECRGFLKMVD